MTLLADAARGVERAGADFLLLCTTTFHKVADQVEEAVDIPLLHLADVVAEAVRPRGWRRSASSARRSRCRTSFFIDRLGPARPVEVVVPDARHHDLLNDAIYERARPRCVLTRTRSRVVAMIEELWDAGAGGVLLGCTELELLVKQADVELPVFPCTTLHVQAALDAALA